MVGHQATLRRHWLCFANRQEQMGLPLVCTPCGVKKIYIDGYQWTEGHAFFDSREKTVHSGQETVNRICRPWVSALLALVLHRAFLSQVCTGRHTLSVLLVIPTPGRPVAQWRRMEGAHQSWISWCLSSFSCQGAASRVCRWRSISLRDFSEVNIPF